MPVTDLPPSWQALLGELSGSAWHRLLVLGAPDRGKSTFCDLLLRQLAAEGTRAMLLDSALAEKMIGPPACVTLGALEDGSYRLRDLYFAGGLDSARRMAAVVAGATHLAERAEGRLVIDTSGTLNGPGRVLKGLKIEALLPNHIVAIEQENELEAFLGALPQANIHRLPPAPGAQPRNAMTRGFSRLQEFKTALAGAQPRILQGIAIEAWDEDAFDWTQGECICGVANASGEDIGLGILNGIETSSGAVKVTTTADPARILRIRPGMALPEELKG